MTAIELLEKIKKNIANGYKHCRELYENSYISKRMKNRNLFRAILQNILLSYMTLLLCQFIFLLVNHNEFSSVLEKEDWWMLIKGNIAFATPAVCYLNSIYVLLLLFPLHYKEGKVMQKITKLAYVIPNALGIIAE